MKLISRKKITRITADDPIGARELLNGLGGLKPRRILFPLFELSCNPTIPLQKIKERRFDLIQRAQDISREDLNLFGGKVISKI